MKEFFDSIWGDIFNAVIIMIIIMIINKIITTFIKRTIKRKNNKNLTTILLYVNKAKSVIMYIIGLLIALSGFEFFSSMSITLLSAVGIIATVLGLAAKESLNNIFGSFELILSKPFEVGDFIRLPEKGISGTVEEISMRHTIIRTINNERELIPNELLNTLIIENCHFSDNEIVLFGDYPIAYSADTDKAIEIIKEEIVNICEVTLKGVNKDAEFPKVRVIEWDSSSIKIRAWIWGKDVGEAYDNFWKFNYVLKTRFDKEGIEIPYDYVNVVMKEEKNTKKSAK